MERAALLKITLNISQITARRTLLLDFVGTISVDPNSMLMPHCIYYDHN